MMEWGLDKMREVERGVRMWMKGGGRVWMKDERFTVTVSVRMGKVGGMDEGRKLRDERQGT
jgi:hypothetical protein